MKRYLVLTLRRAAFDPAMIEPHYAHLATLRERGLLELAGAFSDRSGGAYLLRADNIDAARQIAWADPLHVSGSSELRVYEWNAE